MSKIIGVTVGTPLSVEKIKEKLKPVTSVNGVAADENGNVEVRTVSSEEVKDAVEAALQEAKGRGEFDGYTPVKGVDYWTPTDIAVIQKYIDEAIAKVVGSNTAALGKAVLGTMLLGKGA